MYCVQCGTRNPEDARFCKQCGRPMEPPEERPAQSAEAAHAPEPSPAVMTPDPEARFRELLNQAFRHYDRGEYEAAREACRDALDLKPDSAEAHALLSTLFERMGDLERAIAERERVLELNPSSLADREKLEALRKGQAQIGQRRILSARLPQPGFWESPAGAAVAAVGAALVVMAVGFAILAYRERRADEEARRRETPPPVAATGSVPATPPSQTQPPAFTGAPPATTAQQTPQAGTPPILQNGNRAAVPSGMTAPLPIQPQGAPLERATAPSPPEDPRSAAYFDPTQPSGGTQSSGTTVSGGDRPPPQGPGRIEIVVGPQPGGPQNPSPNTPASGSSAQMESRNNAAIAQNLQMAGRYREAALAWERALAGAGDRAAGYHQNAALCYQRAGDKANARRHYLEAIQAYRDMIAGGGDRDEAEQGIRACEAGLKLVQ